MPDSNIDPTTGEPIDPDKDKGTLVTIPKEEWDTLKAKLDVFDKIGPALTANQTPPTPAAPSGPSLADQVKDIDAEISKLDDDIDAAISEQRGIKSLTRKRDQLTAKRLRLQIQHEDINPALQSGINTIEQLSSTVTRGNMPHYDLVKDHMEETLKSLPADQRMNPQIRQLAYEQALGKNMDKLLAAEREKTLREAETQPALDASRNNRGNAGDAEIPKAKDVLGASGIAAIREKGQTVDEHFKRRGYKNGWADYYKHHEEYFKSQGFGEED